MNNGGRTPAGLEALAGEVPLLPAKASSPRLVYSLFIIHYSLFILVKAQQLHFVGLSTKHTLTIT
jgi:hypothetical protein